MFISLFVSDFSYVYKGSSFKLIVNRAEIRKFTNYRSKYNSGGTGELGFQYLPKIMHSFDGSFSFKLWEDRLTTKNLVKTYMEVNPNNP